MKRKLAIMMILLFGCLSEYAAEQFSLVNDDRGYSYLLINSDMEDFSFKSDFKSIGNSGKVGVFKYTAGLEGQELIDYIASYDASNAQFSKHVDDGTVMIGDVKAGDRIGFYLDRNNGDLIRSWDFQYKHGQAYIAFDKNGGGKDEWMSVRDYSWVVPPPRPNPSGAPLPGSMAVLAVSGIAALATKLKKQKST